MADPDNQQSQTVSKTGSSRGGHRFWATLRALLRTRIVAGVLMVIPIWVTWRIVMFVFDTMRSATEPIAAKVAKHLIENKPDLLPQTVADYLEWMVPVTAVLLTLFLLYLLGLLTANVVGRQLIQKMENLFSRLPMVKTIYRSTKQIVTAIGGGEAMHFQRVVLVEFPHPGMKCIGFLTAVMEDMDTGRKMASVFISTTPNPTTGYMQIVPLDKVSDTNWTVEEAVKLLISGGILSPPKVAFDKIHPVKCPPEAMAAEKAQALHHIDGDARPGTE